MALPETSDVACLSTDGERLYAVGHMHGIYVIDPRARRAADKLHSVESQGVRTEICFEQMLASTLRLAVQSDDSTTLNRAHRLCASMHGAGHPISAVSARSAVRWKWHWQGTCRHPGERYPVRKRPGAAADASVPAALTKVHVASTSRLQQQEQQQMISCRFPFTICESAHQNRSNIRIEQRSPQQQVPH